MEILFKKFHLFTLVANEEIIVAYLNIKEINQFPLFDTEKRKIERFRVMIKVS